MNSLPFRRLLRPTFVLPVFCLLYVLLAISTTAATAPIPNEAWFFSPAENLIRYGHMGTTNLETKGTWLEGIERHTYWVPPLHILAQAGWYLVTGAGLMQMRALSVAWGVLAVIMVYRIGVRLCLGRLGALTGVALLVTDFRFALTSSAGRMDMMCAALGLAGIAAYLELRQRSLPAAVLAGHALVAASCLTHPCGVVHGIALVIVTICLDRSRINLAMSALAAVPYIVALGAWGLYIAQDPTNFLQQFRGNISGLASEAGRSSRFSGLRHPWDAFVEEIRSRYYSQFGEWGGGKIFGGLQMYVLGLYAAAIGVALWNNRMRRSVAGRAAAGATLAIFCSFWLLDGSKASNYLPHLLPWLLLLAGFGLRRLAGGQIALVAALVGIGFIGQFAALFGWRSKDNLHREALPAVRYLEAHARPGERIDGGAEFQFLASNALLFTDDPRLGYLTGRRPDWIVMSGWYGSWIASTRKRDSAFDKYVGQLLDRDSSEVFHTSRVKIYRTRPASPPVIH